MFRLLAVTAFALLVARVLRAPAGTWRYVVGAAVLLLLASQLLPAENPWRVDLVAGLGTLAWLTLAAAPVAAYGLVLRRVRQRTGVDRPLRSHPVGLVAIPDDAALAADTVATLAAETRRATGRAPEAVSVAWRGEDGALVGHARVTVMAALADLQMLWVAAARRRQGIGGRLLAAAEAEAQARGAARMSAGVGSWQDAGFLTRRGYREAARLDLGAGLERLLLTKELA
jgi:GNAT superfamily N-acetyltransferase